jgi:RNA polymerase sigma factor (sigma-70 family)
MDRYAFVLEQLGEDDFRRLRAYQRPEAGDFSLWLIVVTRRLCLDHYRHRYGRVRGDASQAHYSDPGRTSRRRLVDLVRDEVDPESLAAPAGARPDEELATAERSRALAGALEELGPRDRLLLRLRFSEELPVRDIAKLMQFPTLFHVYRRLDAVLKVLRGALGKAGMEGVEP